MCKLTALGQSSSLAPDSSRFGGKPAMVAVAFREFFSD